MVLVQRVNSQSQNTELTESELRIIKPTVDVTSNSGSTITMRLKPFKSTVGINISKYLVIVDKQETNREKREDLSETKQSRLYDYNKAKAEGLSHYITASFASNEITDDGINFIVGDGEKYGDYMNAPLEKGASYALWYGILRSVDGVTTASYVVTERFVAGRQLNPELNYDETLPYKITLGTIIPLLVLAFVGIILFFLRRNSKRRDHHEINRPHAVLDHQQARSDIHLADINQLHTSDCSVTCENHGIIECEKGKQIGHVYQHLQNATDVKPCITDVDYEIPQEECQYEELNVHT